MLLRRVIEHVRTQNWGAVFLDFVIDLLCIETQQVSEQHSVSLVRQFASVFLSAKHS